MPKVGKVERRSRQLVANHSVSTPMPLLATGICDLEIRPGTVIHIGPQQLLRKSQPGINATAGTHVAMPQQSALLEGV